jgi:DNA-directed RNA polymerase specialized sigma subunit
MKNQEKVNIETIMLEYMPNNDIFSTDSIEMYRIKFIIFNCLTDAERRVLLLYAECGTQREVAKMLGVSASAINMYLKKLRTKIKSILEEYAN